MITFRAFGTEFRVHVLTMLTGMLALVLGIRTELPLLTIAVCLHEAAHLIAAKLTGLCVETVELMWFGGAAGIRDIYYSKPLSIVITALAGPIANLLTAVTAAALGWWNIFELPTAAAVIRINMLLMLFNLMPALPLDGGRVFFAVVSPKTGRRTALKIGVALAHLLAVLLISFALYGWFTRRMVNLTYVLMAVFLISSSLKEMNAYKASGMQRALNAFCTEKPLPSRAELIAMKKSAEAGSAAAFINQDIYSIFAVIENDTVAGFLTEDEMMKRILNGNVHKGLQI